LANERGGVDNITVIVVRVGSESRGWFSWLFGSGRKKAADNGAAGGS
jgi:serine/threonine protein phosphatase PrpC